MNDEMQQDQTTQQNDEQDFSIRTGVQAGDDSGTLGSGVGRSGGFLGSGN